MRPYTSYPAQEEQRQKADTGSTGATVLTSVQDSLSQQRVRESLNSFYYNASAVGGFQKYHSRSYHISRLWGCSLLAVEGLRVLRQ
jgi:hypothetical protein